jgi:maltose alpha-D-glucosyltransferase/alpha-amylase
VSSAAPWYKDAIIYQLHVRAFHDSNSDGIGDLPGLTQKLDYLEDLGVTALWLQPFYPSPLKDDGYDIADYRDIHPDYGTLRDFRTFLREAHRRGLKVITELVINHTSDQHAWFQRARRAKPGSRHRDFYVWSDTAEKYGEARIIFKDFEHSNWTWDADAHAYYWHRFYSHQPDLNFDSPDVRKAVFNNMDFWFDMGVDGLRLDAVPYLYEREGTNCENLPETHEFLKALRQHVDRKYEDRMLLAEANQWPEDAVAYFGDGDECHMAFHFPVMPRLFMGMQLEDRFPIIDILDQTPPIPESCQWAIFLRNHDELTLEMVTDEDRDYMYRVYAQEQRARINLGIRRRLAPLMGRSRRRVELMNALLLSLPGTPVVYYGDEIGMGDNIYLGDRNGVRTPMQWSADRNAGFSRGNPQQLYLPVIIDPEYHYEAINVESQQNNSNSLLWWMKRLMALRRELGVFGDGTTEFLQPDNRKVLAFVRQNEQQRVLVVANLSRFAQCAELDLSAFEGMAPVESFGRTQFPAIGADPYLMTLAPHAFYWFGLESVGAQTDVATTAASQLPTLTVSTSWEVLFRTKHVAKLERVLPRFLATRRWFGGKARKVLSTNIVETVPLAVDDSNAYLTIVQVTYAEGSPDVYNVPMAFAPAVSDAEHNDADLQDVIARVRVESSDASVEGLLYDALVDPRFCTELTRIIARSGSRKGASGSIHGLTTRGFRKRVRAATDTVTPTLLMTEQSNTSVIYGDQLIMKLFRRLDEGVNPDLEVGRFLTERTGFAHTAPVAGALEYQRPRRDSMTLGVIHGYVVNEGDAWRLTLDSLEQYFERVSARVDNQNPVLYPSGHFVDALNLDLPTDAEEQIGMYLESARALGQRTAELHLALASRTDDPAFAPESFTTMYQRSLYESLRTKAKETLRLLEKRVRYLPKDARPDARRVVAARPHLRQRFREILDRHIRAQRIRGHGDYHLGQALFTGKDFVILDFEGEPMRSLGERRLKRSPIRDVAGMVRSFHYAAMSALVGGGVRAGDVGLLEPWAHSWYQWVSHVFLKSYVDTAGDAAFVPRTAEERRILLDYHLLDKAFYELHYELHNRPEWVSIPLRGLVALLPTSDQPG